MSNITYIITGQVFTLDSYTFSQDLTTESELFEGVPLDSPDGSDAIPLPLDDE